MTTIPLSPAKSTGKIGSMMGSMMGPLKNPKSWFHYVPIDAEKSDQKLPGNCRSDSPSSIRSSESTSSKSSGYVLRTTLEEFKKPNFELPSVQSEVPAKPTPTPTPSVTTQKNPFTVSTTMKPPPISVAPPIISQSKLTTTIPSVPVLNAQHIIPTMQSVPTRDVDAGILGEPHIDQIWLLRKQITTMSTKIEEMQRTLDDIISILVKNTGMAAENKDKFEKIEDKLSSISSFLLP